MKTFQSPQGILSHINLGHHINSQNDEVHASIYVLATAVTRLQSQVTALQNDVTKLQGLQSQVTALQNDVTTLRGQ